MGLHVLREWDEAAALVLSCPGPVWRHRASLLPVAGLALPQVFLGGESQLLAFAAAVPELAPKMFFAPLPEMFSGAADLGPAWRALGQPAHRPDRVLHLRFGSVRHARLLKGAENAAVLAEAPIAPPSGALNHPFADGATLPAGMARVYSYEMAAAQPRRFGGAEIQANMLPEHFIGADMARPAGRSRAAGGLDLVALADFQSDLWAAGQMPPWAGPKNADRAEMVLLPWNMAHAGSIVPLLLERLAGLWQPGAQLPRVVVLPFNYVGQTGALRALAKLLRTASPHPETALRRLLLGRVTHLRGLPQLAKLSRLAWVDGNDPEHGWTLKRLQISGFDPILIDPGRGEPKADRRLSADEKVWVKSDTSPGASVWPVRAPSLRQLHRLVAMRAGRDRRPTSP